MERRRGTLRTGAVTSQSFRSQKGEEAEGTEGQNIMPRRKSRESETKRTHSKLERESSPKRPRRDGKPATERTSSGHYDVDIMDHADRDQKHRRRLQDALPLEDPVEPESKVGLVAANRELSKKADETNDGVKHSSDPTKIPRSRSYFQHDERGIAGQDGRSFSRRATAERGWWSDQREQQSSDRVGGSKTEASDQKDGKNQARGTENNVWRHDGFYELEANAPPPARKRPAFREKKIEPEPGNAQGVAETESARPSHPERPVSENATREERRGKHPFDSDRSEKPSTGDHTSLYRGERQRFGFPSRERFSGSNGSRGRDRFNERYGDRNQYRPQTVRVEKWKHDLYDEANRSPTPKNEEDHIAEVEALLSS